MSTCNDCRFHDFARAACMANPPVWTYAKWERPQVFPNDRACRLFEAVYVNRNWKEKDEAEREAD